MARKAKAVVVSPVSITNEQGEVTQVEIAGKVLDVIDLGPVEPVEVEEEVVEQSTGPSLVSLMVEQVVDSPKAEEVVVAKEKNEGVGQFIRKLISEGLSNKDILNIVHEQYGNKNTTYACVAWYRNKMKKAGSVVAKSSAMDFITNFAKTQGLSEEAVETLKVEMKVA